MHALKSIVTGDPPERWVPVTTVGDSIARVVGADGKLLAIDTREPVTVYVPARLVKESV